MPSMNSTELRRPLFSKGLGTRLAFVIVIIMLYAALAVGIYNGLTQHTPGANDFYSRWMGARALILNGQNPYDEAVTREIQMGMFGRLARADEDQVAFAYPLYSAYLAAPLVGLPYAMAQALWMALLVCCLVGGALALSVVNRITLTPIALAAIVLSALMFYPSVRAIFLGQYAVVAFACVGVAVLAIASEHHTLAGVLLGISAVKPQPVLFLLPVILFWTWRNGRRRVVWSTLVTLAVLVLSSFAWIPSWLVDFLNGLRAYTQYEPVGPPLDILLKMLLPETLANILFYVFSAGLVVWMLRVVWRNRVQSWYEFQPALGFVGLVTTLMAVRIGSSDQVFLLIIWLAWLSRWCAQRERALIAASVAYLLLVPWLIFLTTLEGNHEALVVGTILPFSTLSVYVVRERVKIPAKSVA